MKKTEDEKTQPIIIKRIKKGGGGHHGGAWKVAYADFVTAMMAFFLLLWLLNVSTAEQKFAISNYFDPTFPKVSSTESGSGGVMGGTSLSTEGAMTNTVQPITQPQIPDTTKKGGEGEGSAVSTGGATDSDAGTAEEEKFKEVETQIRQSVEANPDLKELTTNLMIDVTPEGLRIQIVDQDKTPMFASGSAQMFDKTTKLLALVARAIKPLPNKLSIRGHTDSTPYAPGNTYDNWELSADRANSSRRALLRGGLAPARIANVTGKADTDPLDKANPLAPINRRISINLQREVTDKKAATPAAAAEKPRARTAVPGRWDQPDRDARPDPVEPFRSGGGVLGIP